MKFITIKTAAIIGAALCVLTLIWQLLGEINPPPTYIQEAFPIMREATTSYYAGKKVTFDAEQSKLVLRYDEYQWNQTIKLKAAVWGLTIVGGVLFVLIARKAAKDGPSGYETVESNAPGSE